MKKMIWMPAMLVFGYAMLLWDYHLSNYMFENICEEPDQIGLFVYEQVLLGEEYFIPFPEGLDERRLDERFVFRDNLLLNRERFEEDYEFIVNESIPLSSIGPMALVVTSVIRKSDAQLLGKAVSAANQQGWLNRFSAFEGVPGVSCPSGQDEYGFYNSRKSHDNLLKEVIGIEQP